MRNMSLTNIFPQKYSDIIQKYVGRLDKIIKEYDVIIFMARKAFCFYDSLVLQGELSKNTRCCIMSSRALEYNVLKRFVGKNIAVIDDVVVKGTSITAAMKNLQEVGIEPDIFIAACDIDFIEKSHDYKEYIKEPYVILSETDICEFATYITRYIEATGCPYNIDQPIYQIKFNTYEERDQFLQNNKNVEITSEVQKEFAVSSRVIHFESYFLRNILPDEIDINRVYVKIRVIYDIGLRKISLLPFVLLPAISYETLNKIYDLVRTPSLDKISYRENVKSKYENMLNIFQYVFSNIIILKFLEEQKDFFSYKKVNSNEIAQFSKCLLSEKELLEKMHRFFGEKYISGFQKSSYASLFQINKYISKVYDLVFEKCGTEKYINSCNKEIRKNVLSISMIEKYITDAKGEFDPYAMSNLVDIFIDRGIFVPSVVHTSTGDIVRAYKGGEVAKLTELEMDLFAYMLGLYMENNKKDYLDKTEYEKLCVLFFRNGIGRDIFPNINSEKAQKKDGDCYEISYAKFGPRVSLAKGERYEAGNKVLLADEMRELYLLRLCKRMNERGEYIDKYYVEDNKKQFEDPEWQTFAHVVAYDFSILRQTFLSALKKRTEETRNIFYYISTYNKFLTAISIGRNEKERLLSLVAEIYLFLSVNIDGRNLSVKSILLKIKQKYDGICSGVWKYACYKQKNLFESLFATLSKYNGNVMRCSLDYISKPVDRNPNILQYIDECGEFLVNLAYALYKMGQMYGINMAENQSDFNYIYDIDQDTIAKLDNYYAQPVPENQVLDDISQLRMEAGAIVDKCDIFIAEEAMFYETYKSIFVVYSNKEQLPESIRKYAVLNDSGNNENFNYVKIFCKKEVDIGIQLEKIISLCSSMNSVKIILCDMLHDYEGLFFSKSICKGRNFDKFISNVLAKENDRAIIDREFINCYKYQPAVVNMREYYLVDRTENDTVNGYNMKRYYIVDAQKEINNNIKIEIEKVETKDMKIENANNCRMIETENYYEKCEISQERTEDTLLNENIETIIKQLEELKKIVNSEQKEIIQNTIEGINNKNNSQIVAGLKGIAKFGRDVLTSVVSDALVLYMTKYGVLPPA